MFYLIKKLLDRKWIYLLFDDKRYVLHNGIYTLSYFHKNSVT